MSTDTGYESWTMVDLGTVTLGATTYAAEQQVFANGSTNTTLIGPRGAVYFLRPFAERNGDTGLRQVISWKSGAPLRVKGNEVRVHHIGNMIEVV